MSSSFDPITLTDFQALATLANAKLSPATPYSFTPFSGTDQIANVAFISTTAVYATSFFSDGSTVDLWLFSYKTISGIKTYSWIPTITSFTGQAGSVSFIPTWTWTNPIGSTAPDGYIAVIPQVLGTGYEFCWKDIGLVSTLTEDGNFTGYSFDTTLDANNGGNPSQNLPCGHGTWLKTLNQIHSDLFTNLDLFDGHSYTFNDNFLLSGPWCVSVAQKCYLFINSTPIYDNLEFWYSEADSITGNQLSPEADMLATYIGVNNDANSITWDVNVIVNGVIRIFSDPQGQAPSDWTLSASDPIITINFNPNYLDPDTLLFHTAFEFTFTNTQFLVGTPIVLTCHPNSGGSVLNPTNPFGNGGKVDCVFTGDKIVYTASDETAIHYAGPDAKSAALPSALAAITLTTPTATPDALPTHHRSYCNGVFVANTLATLGIFPYVDVDLPQYLPSATPAESSTLRVALDATLPYIASVDNRGALWPVFRDTDFTPDYLDGLPFTGSKAWQTSIGTKYVERISKTLNPPTMDFAVAPTHIGTTVTSARFLSQNPASVLYLRKGAFPTLVDFDATGVGGTWVDISSIPDFNSDDTWFAGVYNPASGAMTSTLNSVVSTSTATPDGTFFPTLTDEDGVTVPQQEGFSYHFTDETDFTLRPIPLFGYCVYSITARRAPVDNGSGVFVAPSTRTSALAVSMGLMAGFGFGAAGTFSEIQAITIPAGAQSITTDCFFPVLSGSPLAYQCTEAVNVRACVNFQPQIHSKFNAQTVMFQGSPRVVGLYNEQPYYDPVKALLTFVENDQQDAIVLPVAAVVVNDLTATLNLLP